MNGCDQQASFCIRVVPKWMGYVLLYSVSITLLVTFYASWDSWHSPARRLLGTHPKHLLDRDKLLELAKEVTHEYISVNKKLHFDHHCSNCSLVVSSGQLISTAAGKEIDRSACVIRMNDAPTVGYSTDVGRKTTLRFVCFKSLPFLTNAVLTGRGKTDMVAVWGVENPHHKGRATYMLREVLKAHERTPIQFFSMQNEGETKVAELFENELGIDRVNTNTWVSTGMFTMLLAIQMCDSIVVYGLADENHCKLHPDSRIPYHYYGRSMLECEMYRQHQGEMKQGSHRFISEKALFRRWATMLDIRFRHPAWNLTQLRAADGQA
ncbi:alpha-N-acetyl-neuraminyl-2,3-beta-galactosyl-1,3-N-acetyl-galactosaminide alpha-2,6-sialyltransferase-like [Acanthaster planci]|uniref:Alpha-N-acetyl-neuraminyl-2,3-beta-galactosyl-1, 3-N-acetyl-galactosaminide alpha-2,6-sialyltransferase-like n=1 Tax=Acanthaster planci TaxID=133434 RepID=A0A8B7XZS2_ACAPL|nr:alpha-N-acetyl-neuraminyl-2,3-beta-galactosyl-1,3-N-acetyl-galactosaminide alpha-2,6-sialyltransferase-like [Acanthaster planci]XP_022086403.1 alpha-N-acetyl-neuraminyl-2,3-beta-galactosyl-1,3-N-acetyl-galactosaminide alpha-2,6-sialyltransferase-like [Acanthaster planci]